MNATISKDQSTAEVDYAGPECLLALSLALLAPKGVIALTADSYYMVVSNSKIDPFAMSSLGPQHVSNAQDTIQTYQVSF